MEFLLGKSSINKSSHNSSSKNRHHLSTSNDSNYSDNNDEESPLTKYYPNNHPMIPSTCGEIIVKIDSPIDNTKKMSNLYKEPSEDFSFPRPNNEKEDQQRTSIGSGMSNLGAQDPTSKLIGQFLERQKTKGDMSLDMDMEMEELRQQQQQLQPLSQHDNKIPRQVIMSGSGGLRPPLPPDSCWSRNPSDIQSPECASSYQYKNTPTNNNSNNDGSKEIRVSFHESLTSELVRRPSCMYSNVHDDSSSCSSSMSGDDEINYEGNHKDTMHSGEILRSRSNRTNTNTNASFQRMASTLSKTKSRLIDPPSMQFESKSGQIHKSGQLNMRSGLLGKGSVYDEDEEDPFIEDYDLPDEFKSPKVSTLVVLEWVSLIAIVGALICNLAIPVLRHKTLWKLKLWKWEVLILSLICGRLVSGWGIRILVFCIEMNFILRKRVLYFVYGLKKAVQNVIWLGLVLLTWYLLFDERLYEVAKSHPLNVVTKLLIIGEVGAILWLLKTLLVKVLASNFHVKAFFDRIQDSLFNQFVIETLSAPPFFEFHQAQEEDERTMAEVQSLQNSGINVPFELRSTVFARNKSGRSSILQRTPQNGKNVGSNTTSYYKSPVGQSTWFSEPISKKHDEGITIDHLSKLNQQNVSAWNMKRLMRIIRNGALTTLDEHLAAHQYDESQTQIRSEVEAKAAARKIFRNVAKPRSRYIYMDDIMRFMKEDEALKTMSLFEGAIENERISKKSLKNWVVSAFRERRALALTLSDTKSAVNKLHKMVNGIVTIIIVVITFISLNIIQSQTLLFLSSQVVLVAFVFGNTCKNVFESIIFLFVIHPFDVGDRCEIDTIQMVVEEINILTTVFLRYDNLKIVFPNYVLLTKPISNFYRSPDMGDAIELCFHIATPAEKIALIRQRITSYIENKKEHWYPEPMVVLRDAEGLQMLRIAIWLCHRINFQDMGERFVRRALLIEECVKILREMDIEYRIYPLNVNVTSIPPLYYAHVPPPNSNAPPSEGGKEIINH